MNLDKLRPYGAIEIWLLLLLLMRSDTDRYDTSQDSPERINERRSDFSDWSDTNQRTRKLQSDRSGLSWNFYRMRPVWAQVGVKKNLGNAEASPQVTGHGDPLKTRFLATCVTVPTLIIRRSNLTNVINLAEKNEPLAFHLSRSLKVIGTNMDQSPTCDFLLMIHSNHWPVSYRVRDKWVISVEKR